MDRVSSVGDGWGMEGRGGGGPVEGAGRIRKRKEGGIGTRGGQGQGWDRRRKDRTFETRIETEGNISRNMIMGRIQVYGRQT